MSIFSVLILLLLKQKLLKTKIIEINKSRNIKKYSTFCFFLGAMLILLISFNYKFNNNYTGNEKLNLLYYLLFPLTIIAGIICVWTKNKFVNLKISQKKNKIIIIAISVLFITIKILMPIIYTGSYLDEYYHIQGGKNFLKELQISSFYSDESYYNRGIYVTILESIFLFFSKSIFIAKLVPAVIGLLCFFFFYKLLNYVSSKEEKLFALLIYSLNPLVIFNHFYIRMFVFYELFFLITINLILKINYNYQKNKKIKKQLLLLFTLNIFLIINYLISGDIIVFLTGLTTVIGLILTFVNKKNILNFLKKINTTLIITSLLLISLLLLNLILNTDIIKNIILNLKITHGAGDYLKYKHLFLYEYSVITILFIISIFILFETKNKNKKILIIIANTLFILHIFSPTQLQTIRSLFYFIPIFLLISLSSIKYITNNKRIYFILVSFVFFTSISYPLNFFIFPSIPGEINYNEYKKAYDFINKNCSNLIKIAPIHKSEISIFYKTKIDYTTFIKGENSEIFNRYKKEGEKYYTFFGNIKTEINTDLIIKQKDNVCIIVSDEYRHTRRYMEENIYKNLENLYKNKKIFKGIYIYYN